MITSRLAYSSIFFTKMEMNITMEDASSLRCGCMVHYCSLRCIGIHHGYTSNFTEEKRFSPGLFAWRNGSQAGRLTDTMGKRSFHGILFKTQRFFMLDKCFKKKLKIHPMRSSGFHDICRIGPLQDPVTWHGINYTGTQITQWVFQNKRTL